MSQVTMCDFCGTTTRQAAEVVKLKLPKAVVPEALQSRTASNATTDVQLDSCQACAGGIVEVLEEFMTRRFGGITEEDTA